MISDILFQLLTSSLFQLWRNFSLQHKKRWKVYWDIRELHLLKSETFFCVWKLFAFSNLKHAIKELGGLTKERAFEFKQWNFYSLALLFMVKLKQSVPLKWVLRIWNSEWVSEETLHLICFIWSGFFSLFNIIPLVEINFQDCTRIGAYIYTQDFILPLEATHIW